MLDNCRPLKEQKTDMRNLASEVTKELPKVTGMKIITLLDMKTASQNGLQRQISVLNIRVDISTRPPPLLGWGGSLTQPTI